MSGKPLFHLALHSSSASLISWSTFTNVSFMISSFLFSAGVAVWLCINFTCEFNSFIADRLPLSWLWVVLSAAPPAWVRSLLSSDSGPRWTRPVSLGYGLSWVAWSDLDWVGSFFHWVPSFAPCRRQGSLSRTFLNLKILKVPPLWWCAHPLN